MPFATLSKAFVSLITECDEVVVVASPFQRPRVAQRVWCLFEAATAHREGVPTTVRTPPAERDALRTTMEAGSLEAMNVLVSTMLGIDSQSADATMPEDKENIMRMIDGIDGKHRAVDEVFKSALRRWIQQTSHQLWSEHYADAQTYEATGFALTAGEILRQLGEYSAAVSFLERALGVYLALEGPTGPNVATAYANLGTVHDESEGFGAAVECFNKAGEVLRARGMAETTEMATLLNNQVSGFLMPTH